MDPLGTNPFGILTFIVAPAILTNASSIMALSTGNRFGLAIDRVKAIVAELELKPGELGEAAAVRVEQLKVAHQRVQFLVRTLTALYFAVGSFVSATLLSLFGAILFSTQLGSLHRVALVISISAGVAGVAALVKACMLLVKESLLARQLLDDELNLKLDLKFSRLGKASQRIDEA